MRYRQQITEVTSLPFKHLDNIPTYYHDMRSYLICQYQQKCLKSYTVRTQTTTVFSSSSSSSSPPPASSSSCCSTSSPPPLPCLYSSSLFSPYSSCSSSSSFFSSASPFSFPPPPPSLLFLLHRRLLLCVSWQMLKLFHIIVFIYRLLIIDCLINNKLKINLM